LKEGFYLYNNILYLQVSEEKEEDKPKTKSVEKTVWDWVLVNGNKPIWTRKYVFHVEPYS